MELERVVPRVYTSITINYIIPIWNWSSSLILLSLFIKCITLFLYGIGALLSPLQNIFIYVITLFLYGIGASWYN